MATAASALFVAAALSVTLCASRMDAEPQTRNAPAPVEFEVASIHSTPPDAQLANLSTAGGGFSAQNVSVRRLIEYAYDLRPLQLGDGPGWINTQRYSIAAKSAASEAEAKRKLRQLLTCRFSLRMKRTAEQRRVYALMIANLGGAAGHERSRAPSQQNPGTRHT